MGRYGYVERIRQDGEFVAVLLDRVMGLLLKSLQECLAESASLRSDLGIPDIFPVPVRQRGRDKCRECGWLHSVDQLHHVRADRVVCLSSPSHLSDADAHLQEVAHGWVCTLLSFHTRSGKPGISSSPP